MDSELRKTIDDLGTLWHDYKKTNDERIERIEKGLSEADKTEMLEKMNADLDGLVDLKDRLEKLEVIASRPPIGKNEGLSPEEIEYKEAFGKFVRKGIESEALQTKTIQTTVDADGGYAVPEQLDRSILQVERDIGSMRSVAAQITVGTPDYKKLVNLGGAASGWVGETAARPETGSPTLAQLTVSMGEIYANPASTQTALDDAFFDVEGWLIDEVGIEFATEENLAFWSGDGTNKPKGLIDGTITTQDDSARAFGTIQKVTTTSGVGTVGGDDLITTIHKMKQGYRTGARWMMSTATLAAVRKLQDSNGQYLWVPGLREGEASTLLGYAITENEDVADIASGALAMAFANFQRAYLIVDRIGTRVLRDPYTNKPHVHFYVTKRVGGMLLDSNAVKLVEIQSV